MLTRQRLQELEDLFKETKTLRVSGETLEQLIESAKLAAAAESDPFAPNWEWLSRCKALAKATRMPVSEYDTLQDMADLRHALSAAVDEIKRQSSMRTLHYNRSRTQGGKIKELEEEVRELRRKLYPNSH